VFAPHPDDETWGCGGTIAKKLAEGYEVLVVVITDGRYAFLKMLGIDSDPTPEELKEIRKEEVKRAMRILGVPEENLVFLDFTDGALENEEEKAQEKITEILSKNPPAEVYFPYEKDTHPDHRVTNQIVRNSIRRLGISTLTYKYSIAQKYSRIGPVIDILVNLWRAHMIRVDISEFLALKEVAVRQFHSELTNISNRQQRPLADSVGKFLNGKEIFYLDR